MGFTFDNESGILVYKTSGSLVKEDIKAFYQHLAGDNSYPRNLRTLIDASKCHFDLELNDLRELFDELGKAFEQYDSIAEAIVVDNPWATVIATLFADGLKDPNYNFKVFSTITGAENWLIHR